MRLRLKHQEPLVKRALEHQRNDKRCGSNKESLVHIIDRRVALVLLQARQQLVVVGVDYE